ncbi:hypothetical protein QYE76_037830 [Lolium multiflorum]|uniref:Uncharacterized protein n=1 Tax=Lolium multiflorum TaxID=4521 RepID=A0AAD8WQB6_LOLMU|nr:hypothetical protein QYE76_037830 [Lolium multiflorum]
MLKSAEIEIRKEHQVLMVNKTTSFKKHGKPNNKGNFKKGAQESCAPPEKPKADPKPDTVCYYCKEKGHWKRNFSKYLADLKSGLIKKKKDRRAYEVGPRGALTIGRRGQHGAAPAYGVGPRAPPTLPFRLLKLSVAKPYYREPRYEIVPDAANPISGIQEIASGIPPERESSPEDSTSP